MATAVHHLSYGEFLERFGKGYEFWHGEAISKGLPKWVHGLLQKIIMALLDNAGFISASEVELRIEQDARPKPDVIALRKLPAGPYPTEAPEIVVEIISEDDTYPRVREKCRKYEEWRCGRIFLVDPSDRSVSEWKAGALTVATDLAGVPVEDIWKELDRQFPQK